MLKKSLAAQKEGYIIVYQYLPSPIAVVSTCYSRVKGPGVSTFGTGLCTPTSSVENASAKLSLLPRV